VEDGWGATYYGQFPAKPAINPRDPFSASSQRVLRGGGWDCAASSCRSSSRVANVPAHRNLNIGFRVSLPVDAVKRSLENKTATSTTGQSSERPKTAPPPAVAPFDATAAKQHQQAWAKHLGEPVETTNSIGMKLRLIPPGEFLMGSAMSADELARLFADGGAKVENFKNEFPQHPVRITQPFYLGIHEVTVGQFRKFVQAANYQTEAETDGHGGRGLNLSSGQWETTPDWNWTTPGFEQTDEYPVVQVSWNDAVAFCEWLSQKDRVEYRLPTEAEWEYACRAGATTLYQHGDDPEGLSLVGNVADSTLKTKFGSWATINASDGYAFTSPAGNYLPNRFGIHDLHGNVWEWCGDYYGSDYYTSSPLVDPRGLSEGSLRVNRGGCWFAASPFARSAFRRGFPPDVRNNGMGFRVLRSSVLK